MTDRPTHSLVAISFGLAIACFGAFQQFKLPVALPVLLDLYGYDRAVAGGFMSVYAFVGIVVSLKLGRIIERLGALMPLVVGMGLFALGSILTLAWPQHGLLVLTARGLEGLGFAVVAIVGPVMANAFAPPRYLPIVIGLTAAWIPVGQLTATLAAPVFLSGVGWQGLWWLAIALSLGFALWAHRYKASCRGRSRWLKWWYIRSAWFFADPRSPSTGSAARE